MILDVSTREEAGVTIVGLKGRLTLGNQLVTTENKMRTLLEQSGTKCILDLSELDYTDSAGIGLIMMCAGTARSNGGQLHIAGPNDRVKKIFDIAHVGQVIPVFPDIPAALSAFAA
jgi:anti-sigma B factor antagonist